MGDRGTIVDDGRLEEARNKINRGRNVACVSDVHVSAREGVLLRVWVSDVNHDAVVTNGGTHGVHS
jgi:hypothetical protein